LQLALPPITLLRSFAEKQFCKKAQTFVSSKRKWFTVSISLICGHASCDLEY